MKRFLLIIVTVCLFPTVLFGQKTTLSGKVKCRGKCTVSTIQTITTPIADWTGIDALPAQVIPTGRIGSTAWAAFNVPGSTVQIVDQTNAQCAALYSAHCIQFTVNTALVSDGQTAIIYLDPQYATTLHRNQYLVNGVSTTGGMWFQYRISVDVAGNAYLVNVGAQIKNLLMRNNVCLPDVTDLWNDANGNCSGNYGFFMHGFGYSFAGVNPNIGVLDDSTAGGIFHTEAANIVNGIFIKAQARNSGAVGSGKVKANGVELMNCDTGLVCPAPFANFGSSAPDASPTIVAFQLGIRYFQHCTNGCANTTFKVTIADVKVCGNDCIGY